MQYRRSLDGIRGVAVTAVVAYHIFTYSAHNYFPGGWGGVDVFFVLSGFLISTILIDEVSRSGGYLDMGSFYFRRFVRLGPALGLLLVALGAVAILRPGSRGQDFADIGYSLAYLMNWARAFNWAPDAGGALGHTWSLSVEEQFYFIWPLAMILLIRARKSAPFIIAGAVAVAVLWRCVLVAHGAHYQRTYNGFDTHADPILIGCLVAFLPEVVTKYGALASRTAIIPVLAIAAVFLKMHIWSRYGEYAGVTIVALCAAWILVAACVDGVVTRALSVRPAVYTGRISYGWYLWHWPVLYLANHAHYLGTGTNMALAAAAYVIAAASFTFVERPVSARFKDLMRKPVASPQSA